MAGRDDPLYDVIFGAYFAPLGTTHPDARCQRIAAAIRDRYELAERDGSCSTPPDDPTVTLVTCRDCNGTGTLKGEKRGTFYGVKWCDVCAGSGSVPSGTYNDPVSATNWPDTTR